MNKSCFSTLANSYTAPVSPPEVLRSEVAGHVVILGLYLKISITLSYLTSPLHLHLRVGVVKDERLGYYD